jgi:hypothetical protein
MKSYQATNSKEFTYPEMIRLDSLVFEKLNDAESALAKLKQGADFKWIKANTEGQVPRDAPGFMALDEAVIMTKDLPSAVQKALSGVRSEDLRLYESPAGHFYVLYVQDLVPPREQPFEEVKNTIAQRVFYDKLTKSLEDWFNKLKESADIRIYVAGPEKDKEAGKAN